MQPNDPDQQWQQPSPAQTGAPYVAPQVESPQPVQTQPQPMPAPAAPVVSVVEPLPEQTAEVAPMENTVNENSVVASTPIEAPIQTGQGSELDSDDTDTDEPLIRWQASEYVQRDRSLVWYLLLGVVTIVLTLVAILWMKTITFAILVPVMAIALVVYTRRSPNIVSYILSKKGFYVNDKLYPYAEFKAFSVLSHAGNHSFQLIPRKRFQLGQTAYFTDEIGESVVDMLVARLPMKDDKPDIYDRLTSKLKM